MNLSIFFTTVFGNRKEQIAKVGKAMKTTFTNSNLPARLRKTEVLTHLLSHLLTLGQKFAMVGLVKLRGRPK